MTQDSSNAFARTVGHSGPTAAAASHRVLPDRSAACISSTPRRHSRQLSVPTEGVPPVVAEVQHTCAPMLLSGDHQSGDDIGARVPLRDRLPSSGSTGGWTAPVANTPPGLVRASAGASGGDWIAPVAGAPLSFPRARSGDGAGGWIAPMASSPLSFPRARSGASAGGWIAPVASFPLGLARANSGASAGGWIAPVPSSTLGLPRAKSGASAGGWIAPVAAAPLGLPRANSGASAGGRIAPMAAAPLGLPRASSGVSASGSISDWVAPVAQLPKHGHVPRATPSLSHGVVCTRAGVVCTRAGAVSAHAASVNVQRPHDIPSLSRTVNTGMPILSRALSTSMPLTLLRVFPLRSPTVHSFPSAPHQTLSPEHQVVAPPCAVPDAPSEDAARHQNSPMEHADVHKEASASEAQSNAHVAVGRFPGVSVASARIQRRHTLPEVNLGGTPRLMGDTVVKCAARRLSTVSLQETRPLSTKAMPLINMPMRPHRQPPDHCIVLLARGLMGSGKSTVMQMLSYLLGGEVVNQDEFAHFGRSARYKFLNAVKERGQLDNWLFVDKINTQAKHRTEIVERIRDDATIILVDFVHPDDADGTYDNAIALCEQRIGKRQGGHRTLYPGPKLHGILARTVADQEPLTADEMQRIVATIKVDLTCAPVDMAQSVLRALADIHTQTQRARTHINGHEDDPNPNPYPKSAQPNADTAESTQERTHQQTPEVIDQVDQQLPKIMEMDEEAAERFGSHPRTEQNNGHVSEHDHPQPETAQNTGRTEEHDPLQAQKNEINHCEGEQVVEINEHAENNRAQSVIRPLPIPVFAMMDLEKALRFVELREKYIAWEMRDHFKMASISYIGIFFDEQSLKQLDNLFQETEHTEHKKLDVSNLHTTLLYVGGKKVERFDEIAAWESRQVNVRLTALAFDENVVTASVNLPSTVPCTNQYPHITLALKPGTKAVESNNLLARVAKGEAECYKLEPILLKGVVKKMLL